MKQTHEIKIKGKRKNNSECAEVKFYMDRIGS